MNNKRAKALRREFHSLNGRQPNPAVWKMTSKGLKPVVASEWRRFKKAQA